MTNEQVALLPCPFCGGAADLIRASQQIDEEQDIWTNPEMRLIWIAECNNCCRTYVDSEAEATTAWNRRSYPPVSGEVGELVQEAKRQLHIFERLSRYEAERLLSALESSDRERATAFECGRDSLLVALVVAVRELQDAGHNQAADKIERILEQLEARKG